MSKRGAHSRPPWIPAPTDRYNLLQLAELEKQRSQYERFGEAEQFMYHAGKVERYEPRLECMAYMGNFDELLGTQPVR